MNVVKTTAEHWVVTGPVWALQQCRLEKVRVEWALPLCSPLLPLLILFPSFVFTDPMWFSHRQPHQLGTRAHTCRTRVRSVQSFWQSYCLLETCSTLEVWSGIINCVVVIMSLSCRHPSSRGAATPTRPPSLFLCPCSKVLQSTFTQVIQLGLKTPEYNALYIQVKC